jgi:hypothetical protein
MFESVIFVFFSYELLYDFKKKITNFENQFGTDMNQLAQVDKTLKNLKNLIYDEFVLLIEEENTEHPFKSIFATLEAFKIAINKVILPHSPPPYQLFQIIWRQVVCRGSLG